MRETGNSIIAIFTALIAPQNPAVSNTRVLANVVVEFALWLHAVPRIARGGPEFLILIAADAANHRCDAAAQMRHLNGEIGMAIEHAGIDQPDRRHHQRKFPSYGPRRVVSVEFARIVQSQCRVHEHIHAEALCLGPEWLERWIVQEKTRRFRM